MKENLIIKSLGLVLLVGAIFLTAYLLVANSQKAIGSIDFDFGGYYSTTTPQAAQYGAKIVVLKSGYGVLGSVLFTGSPANKPGRITLYNATTSNVNLRTGGRATSTIFLAEFDPGQATSTSYVFDTTFTDGLLMVTNDIPATSTITWK